MAKGVTEVNNGNFDKEVTKSSVPVLVDFWAEWCGPCRKVGPVIEEIGKESTGEYKVAKLNVDDNPDIATKFGVMSIPTMIVFKDGEEVERLVGAVPKDNILDKLKNHL